MFCLGHSLTRSGLLQNRLNVYPRLYLLHKNCRHRSVHLAFRGVKSVSESAIFSTITGTHVLAHKASNALTFLLHECGRVSSGKCKSLSQRALIINIITPCYLHCRAACFAYSLSDPKSHLILKTVTLFISPSHTHTRKCALTFNEILKHLSFQFNPDLTLNRFSHIRACFFLSFTHKTLI